MFNRRLHAYLRALMGSRADRVGPFLLSFDEHDTGLFRNYAVPDDSAVPHPTDVAELIAAFTSRGRVPRLEYLPEVSPGVQPALLAAGFVVERRLPVMTCPPRDAIARPVQNIELMLAMSQTQLRQVAEVQNEAYGVEKTTDHDVARLLGTIEGSGLVGLAIDQVTRRGVGGGLCAPPHDGVSELAAVGVLPAYRRRGIAAAMTAFLTRACPDLGITAPFLTPAGQAEERIYHTVGYRTELEMLHISRPPEQNQRP